MAFGCREFEQRMNRLLDQRRSPTADATIFAHAERCSACREQLLSVEAVMAGMATLNSPKLESDLAPCVTGMAALRQRRTNIFQRIAVPLIASSLAASAFFSVSIWYRDVERDNRLSEVPQQQTLTVQSAVSPTVPKAEPIESQLENTLIEEVRIQELRGFLAWAVDPNSVNGSEEIVGSPEEWMARLPGIQYGLRPIGTSMKAAFDAIWRTFPRVDATSATILSAALLT